MGRTTLMVTAAVLLSVLSSRSALADDSAQADENFQVGRALLKDKRYAEACPKFEQSQRQDPASGTLLALAYCQELTGTLADAWAHYVAAAELAAREGHEDRQTAANERAQALASRLSTLTVVVPPELLTLPDFHLLRDGAELERSSFGLPLPSNGGSHALQASASGHVRWASVILLQKEGDHQTLIVPVLELLPAAAASTSARDARTLVVPEDPGRATESARPLERASLVAAAGGLVAAGLGVAFGLSAQAQNDASKADGHCDATGCDARGSELRRDALSAARGSTWSFVAGGALAACSLTLYVTSRSGASKRATRIGGGAGAPGVAVSGDF